MPTTPTPTAANRGRFRLTLLTSNPTAAQITLGGGTNPLADAAIGDAGNIVGISLSSSTVNADGGNISMRGVGYAGTGSDAGIALNASTVETTGSGTITTIGTGGINVDNQYQGYNRGVDIESSSMTTTGGNLTITGVGGSQGPYSAENQGVYIYESSIGTTTGALTINGTGGQGYLYDQGVLADSSYIGTTTGTLTLNGTGGPDGGGPDYGIELAYTGITTTSGAMQFTASAGINFSGNNGLEVIGNGLTTGDITFEADSLILARTPSRPPATLRSSPIPPRARPSPWQERAAISTSPPACWITPPPVPSPSARAGIRA